MFIGILAHDLRNPLGAIATASDLLLRRESSDRNAALIQRIHASAERMTGMIEQILDFTCARTGGGMKIDLAPVDLHALSVRVIEKIEAAAPQHIAVEATGDTHGEWDGDGLAQVISNLPFRRAGTKGKAQKSNGLGLGLYIVEQVVLLHGARISVHSAPSEGTTFSVSVREGPSVRGLVS